MSTKQGLRTEGEPPEPIASAGGETILLVDDEASLRRLVRRALERHGYHVIEAGDGETGLTLARQPGSIDLLLSDLVMPVMSGTELASRLREVHQDLKVLFMSGYTEGAAADRGIMTGDAAYLEKPFTLEALVEMVRRALDS